MLGRTNAAVWAVWAGWVGLVSGCTCLAATSDLDEFKVKRQETFAFTQKPSVKLVGDRVDISFESQGYCDTTVAIENADGKILRHLASGVLGPKAPEPFQKNALKQSVVWDGKDDQGKYLDNKASLTVRVSLGLKPQFERSLYWQPKRRLGNGPPLMKATPEGMYVFDAMGVDHLRVFSHSGDYIRTVYPFPAEQLKNVKDLNWVDFPQGYSLPLKNSPYQQTLLTSGCNSLGRMGMAGVGATAMEIWKNRIALAGIRLNRLAVEGSTGGMPLAGPDTLLTYVSTGSNADGKTKPTSPTSLAMSVDGKWLYVTGFIWRTGWCYDALHGVARIPFDGAGKLEPFLGSLKQDDFGSDNAHFNGATSVDCDAQGRLYVSDFMNDRIQIFSPEGKHLKTIAVAKPAQVVIHKQSQELYVFSWPLYTVNLGKSAKKYDSILTRFGPYDNPVQLSACPLPLPSYGGAHNPWWDSSPLMYRAEVDSWAAAPTIWLAAEQAGSNRITPWNEMNIRIFELKGNTLELKHGFDGEVAKTMGRKKLIPCVSQIQRLYVNPAVGKLYLAEPDTFKAFTQLVEIDPATGAVKIIELPCAAEDVAFDINGLFYLRTVDVIGRYDPAQNFREVPWDYGEEVNNFALENRSTKLLSGLVFPSTSTVCFHQGGMYVSPKGHLVVSCANALFTAAERMEEKLVTYSKPFKPNLYPGRPCGVEAHIWDKHGKLVLQDALPGLPMCDGIALDRDGGIYVMATPVRHHDGKPYFNSFTCTLFKAKSGKAKIISSGTANVPVPLPSHQKPARNPEMGSGWIEGVEWLYGGVGFMGFNAKNDGGGCACWHARFALDYFARSFAPEMDQFRVAVLDSNGNLILRVGQYGNVDDGKPLVAEGGPPQTRSIGGDETGLMHACYVATHTDRRLFIADIGNMRIASVALGYHAEEKVALKNHQDGAVPEK